MYFHKGNIWGVWRGEGRVEGWVKKTFSTLAIERHDLSPPTLDIFYIKNTSARLNL